MQSHTTPPPNLVDNNLGQDGQEQEMLANGIYMGFPKRVFDRHATFCYSGKKPILSTTAYVCPRCLARLVLEFGFGIGFGFGLGFGFGVGVGLVVSSWWYWNNQQLVSPYDLLCTLLYLFFLLLLLLLHHHLLCTVE